MVTIGGGVKSLGEELFRGPWISGEDVVKVFKRLFLKGSVMVDVTWGGGGNLSVHDCGYCSYIFVEGIADMREEEKKRKRRGGGWWEMSQIL